MVLDKRLRPIVKSPDMPQLLRELQDIWEAEQLRRNDFYDWVNPNVKAEFIDGEVVVHSPVRLKHNLVTGALSRAARLSSSGALVTFIS